MSRPKNVTVVSGNTVFSLSPSKFKAFLTAKAAGAPLPTLGKVVGADVVSVNGLTPETAAALLATMTPPEPVVATVPTVVTEPTPTVVTVAA